MKLSVVIVTKNRKAALLRCVESVHEAFVADSELIVVDDHSDDGTERLRASDLGFPACAIFHSPAPLMMVRARNEGARRARGKCVLFIDDDNVVDPRMIELLVAAADAHPEYGILGPSMHYLDDGSKYMDYQRISLTTGKTFGRIDSSNRALCDSDGIPNVFLVRSEVFEQCGYFDEDLVQTFTEPDFAFTARRTGWRCAIVPAAKTFHDVHRADRLTPRSQGGMFVQKAYCLMRNRCVIVGRYGRWYQKAAFTFLFSWLWPLVYSATMLRHGRLDLIRLYWAGWRDGVRFLLTGRLVNSLPRLLAKAERG